MEPIDGSETSVFKTQTQGKYPKENILHKEHGERLKSRNILKLRTPFASPKHWPRKKRYLTSQGHENNTQRLKTYTPK
jgi:hypothetical protein